MALGLTNNKAWFDRAFLSIAQKNTGSGGAEVETRAFTKSLSFSGGGLGFDSLEVFGGKIDKASSREDIELSFDGIPASTRDFDWVFHGTTSTAKSISSFSSTKKYRATILWTEKTGVTSATQAITTAESYRHIYAEARNTSLDYNMDAGEELTATLGFSLAVEDETGGSNVAKDFITTTGTLSAVPSYTTGTKF